MVHKARRGLVIGGSITVGVSWSAAAFASVVVNGTADCGSCGRNASRYWIPVVGPALTIERPLDAGAVGPLVWSLTEAAGLAMLIAGIIGHDVETPAVERPLIRR